MEDAALVGDVETMQQLLTVHGDEPEWFGKNIVSYAAEAGHLHAAKWAYAKGFEMDQTCVVDVISAGHLAVLQWMFLEVGYAWNNFFFEIAVNNNHVEMVKWMRVTFG